MNIVRTSFTLSVAIVVLLPFQQKATAQKITIYNRTANDLFVAVLTQKEIQSVGSISGGGVSTVTQPNFFLSEGWWKINRYGDSVTIDKPDYIRIIDSRGRELALRDEQIRTNPNKRYRVHLVDYKTSPSDFRNMILNAQIREGLNQRYWYTKFNRFAVRGKSIEVTENMMKRFNPPRRFKSELVDEYGSNGIPNS